MNRIRRVASFTITLLVAITFLACSSDSLDRAQWEGMSSEARLLYVKSLLGEEMSKEAKGGNDRTYPLTPDEYMTKIETAYASGDQRTPREIFSEMSSSR